MCETIVRAGILVKSDGTAPTAEEIFNYSPTGEMFMVFEWYRAARIALGATPDTPRVVALRGISVEECPWLEHDLNPGDVVPVDGEHIFPLDAVLKVV
jgi:hypothetical protein